MREPMPLDALCDASGRVRQLLHAGATWRWSAGRSASSPAGGMAADMARDYYIARAADGAQWWIFRECGAPRRWFVHGCFA